MAQIKPTMCKQLDGSAALGGGELKIFEVFVIGPGGIMLAHGCNKQVSKVDLDIFSGMLTAFRYLLRDSLKGNQRLNSISLTNMWVVSEGDEDFSLVVIGIGNAGPIFTDKLKRLRQDFYGLHMKEIQFNMVNSVLHVECQHMTDKILKYNDE